MQPMPLLNGQHFAEAEASDQHVNPGGPRAYERRSTRRLKHSPHESRATTRAEQRIEELGRRNDLAIRANSAKDQDLALRKNRCRMKGAGKLKGSHLLRRSRLLIKNEDGSSRPSIASLPAND
jgi:hypothetical protein